MTPSMRPPLKWTLLGATVVLCLAAVGNRYYEVLPGLVVKSPANGATTFTVNGTNGNVEAGGYLSLSGQTNRVTVEDGSLKLDGSTFTGGGETILTNADNRVYFKQPTNALMLGSSNFDSYAEIHHGTNMLRFQAAFDDSNNRDGDNYLFSPIYLTYTATVTNDRNFGIMQLDVKPPHNGAYTNHVPSVIGLYVDNDAGVPATNAIYLNEGSTGPINGSAAIMAVCFPNNDAEANTEAVGIASFMYGAYTPWQIGIASVVDASLSSPTNIAQSGIIWQTSNGHNVGGYFEITSDWPVTEPVVEQSVLLVDARTTDSPLLTCRTNNGARVFTVENTGALTFGPTAGTNQLYVIGNDLYFNGQKVSLTAP